MDKNKIITLKDYDTFSIIYMVKMNLCGLHERIYEMKHDVDTSYSLWSDDDGNVCFGPDDKVKWGWNISSGCAEFITKDKKVAENVLSTLKIYKNFIINKL